MVRHLIGESLLKLRIRQAYSISSSEYAEDEKLLSDEVVAGTPSLRLELDAADEKDMCGWKGEKPPRALVSSSSRRFAASTSLRVSGLLSSSKLFATFVSVSYAA